MGIQLKVWEKDGAVRVYINARFSEIKYQAADGSYFKADENGKVEVNFKSSMSGAYGSAAHAVMAYFGITSDMDFSAFKERVENAKGPRGGSFNEGVFISSLVA